MTQWQTLGGVAPAELADTRLQLHHAAQLLAEVGETHLPHAPDTSHTAQTWDAQHGALATGALAAGAIGHGALRVELAVREFALLLRGADGAVRARFALAGETLSGARGWLENALREHGGDALRAKLTHPGFDLPAHEVATGGPFAPAPDALAELARWFANAHAALRVLAENDARAEPLLCWPHHFDLATLLVLAQGDAGSATRTVGAGFSPGDDAIAQPYFYVNHWPTQKTFTPRAELRVGRWEHRHFHGALLLGETLVAEAEARQREQLAQFLQEAVAKNCEHGAGIAV